LLQYAKPHAQKPTLQINTLKKNPPHGLDSGPLIPNWLVVEDIPPLEAGRIHLWRLDLDGDTPGADVWSLLSPKEQERAQAINHPPARRTYERARAAKRRILAGYLGIEPEALALAIGPRGKPYIDAPAGNLQFNLTHSADLALLAVTRGNEIGLDAEQVRPRKGLLRIARRMFGSDQAEALRDLEEAEQLRRFHVLWTRLEAGVKCHGGGLFDGEAHQEQGISLTSFVPLAGYQACVAVPGECPDLSDWRTLTYRL